MVSTLSKALNIFGTSIYHKITSVHFELNPLKVKAKRPRFLTKKNIEAILKSPSVVLKKLLAKEVFDSPQFKDHIKKTGKQA